MCFKLVLLSHIIYTYYIYIYCWRWLKTKKLGSQLDHMSCSNIHLQVQLETRTTGLVWGGYTAATIGDIYLLRKPPYYSHSRTFTWQWNRPRQNHLKCGFSMFFLLYFERYQSDLPGNFETCLAIPWVFYLQADSSWTSLPKRLTVTNHQKGAVGILDDFFGASETTILHHQKDAILG